MFGRSPFLSVSLLRAGAVLGAVVLSCTMPKAVLWSQSRIDPMLDVSMTAYIVSAENVAAAAANTSVKEQIVVTWTVPGMRNESYKRAVEELATQLRGQGLALVDSPEDADLVFEFYLEETSATMFRTIRTSHGSTNYGSPPVGDIILDRMRSKNILTMAVWNQGNWVDPIKRLDIWIQNLRHTQVLPDSLQPGWIAVLEPPGKSLDFNSRIPIYVDLLLSAYGKNVEEKHSIRPGPLHKK